MFVRLLRWVRRYITARSSWPRTEQDLFIDYNREGIKARLGRWLADTPKGKEQL